MSKINVFSVHPIGMMFATSDMSITIGDTQRAFYRAHLHAARQAAQLMIPSHVLRDDLGDQKMKFGPGAETSPTSDLYKIMQMGLASYWDWSTSSWMPVPRHEQSIQDQTERFLET